MENKRQAEIALKKTGEQTFAHHKNCQNESKRNYQSPKLLTRKTQNKQKMIIQKNKEEFPSTLCYISPKKTLQKMNGHCDSTTSLASLCGSPKSRIRYGDTIIQNCDNSRILSSQWDQISELEENNKLLEKNQQLERNLKIYEGKILRLEQENSYCLLQIQKLTHIITDRDNLLKEVEKEISRKELALKEMKESKENQITMLEERINQLNRVLNEKNSIMSFSEDTEDGDKSIFNIVELQVEVEELRRKNFDLYEKIKYLEIQEHVYQKLLADHQEEKNMNEKLRGINRRLSRKVSKLESTKSRGKFDEDRSILFELSPSK